MTVVCMAGFDNIGGQIKAFSESRGLRYISKKDSYPLMHRDVYQKRLRI
jgi:hypothetical protein